MNTVERGSIVRRLASVAILALAVLAGPSFGQKAERPSVKVGDRWQFVMYYGIPSTTPNRAWVVKSVTPTGIEGTENDEPLMLTPDLNVLEYRKSAARSLASPPGPTGMPQRHAPS